MPSKRRNSILLVNSWLTALMVINQGNHSENIRRFPVAYRPTPIAFKRFKEGKRPQSRSGGVREDWSPRHPHGIPRGRAMRHGTGIGAQLASDAHHCRLQTSSQVRGNVRSVHLTILHICSVNLRVLFVIGMTHVIVSPFFCKISGGRSMRPAVHHYHGVFNGSQRSAAQV